MRDNDIKNEIGNAEDSVCDLANWLDEIRTDAAAEGAEDHAALYERVSTALWSAQRELVRAYTLLLNGDPDNGVEPLNEE